MIEEGTAPSKHMSSKDWIAYSLVRISSILVKFPLVEDWKLMRNITWKTALMTV